MPDPLMALLIGVLVASLGLLLGWPDQGLVARWRRMRRLSIRVLSEDALKHIHKAELKGQRPTLHSVAGALQVNVNRAAELVDDIEKRELVIPDGDGFRLTPAGREAALHVIRAHRLWESYLAEDTGFAELEWHPLAEQYEHALSRDETDALDTRLSHPTHDPHGDPIPTATGELVPHVGKPLTSIALNQLARIVHIEDEPEMVYAQLVAEGLHPGMCVRLIETTPQRVRFWVNGDQHVLAPIVAANISVAPIAQASPAEADRGEPLNALKPGEKGRVIRLSPRCRGPERRRMMDLGILPGTIIEAELISAGGDPTAYRIRDALIALRAEQARFIHILRLPEATS
ncbi:MAG TPA: metal-dependent transcriptional regulator [Anaerolineae bacterium]|nr:metal-dependent transcriptional regulator [Anaerolineae bacterium]